MYVGEPLLNPFLTHPEMKSFCNNQSFDLGFQIGHIKPRKFRLFEKYSLFDPQNNNHNARLFAVLTRHREINLVSDGTKITDNKLTDK